MKGEVEILMNAENDKKRLEIINVNIFLLF